MRKLNIFFVLLSTASALFLSFPKQHRMPVTGARTLGTTLVFRTGRLAETLHVTDDVDDPSVVNAELVLDVETIDTEASIERSNSEKDTELVMTLVEDDEWAGLAMELSALVTKAVQEDMKRLTREFLGKDEYKVGDISREVDSRVKAEVARIRDKPEYELGDLSLVLDEVAKDMVCEMTGKDPGQYEFGDLSIEIDKRVKETVAVFCGKEEYEVGDLSREIAKRAKNLAAEFTGKDEYEFGDVSKELNKRRAQWVKDFLGAEAGDSYEFGSITKKAITNFTGKDDYEFGDISRKISGGMKKFFGGNKPVSNNDMNE